MVNRVDGKSLWTRSRRLGMMLLQLLSMSWCRSYGNNSPPRPKLLRKLNISPATTLSLLYAYTAVQQYGTI
jgi:hypothetical protein